MRREKEEHQARLREKSMQEGLHRRLYSDTTLQHMRLRLQERIDAKRTQIEQRVREIEDRRARRDGHAASQEL